MRYTSDGFAFHTTRPEFQVRVFPDGIRPDAIYHPPADDGLSLDQVNRLAHLGNVRAARALVEAISHWLDGGIALDADGFILENGAKLGNTPALHMEIIPQLLAKGLRQLKVIQAEDAANVARFVKAWPKATEPEGWDQ